MMPFDANRVLPKLWQGSKETFHHPSIRQFDVIVLCAREIQPRAQDLPGHLTVLRLPIDDGPDLTDREKFDVCQTAKSVARYVRNGRRVLVTCAQGRNRSGIVSACAVHLLTGLSGSACIRVVRKARLNALTNPYFVKHLEMLPRGVAA